MTSPAGRYLCDVRDAFAPLRTTTSVAELLAAVPARVAGLGYHRVLVSRLTAWTWLPHAAVMLDGPGTAEGLVRAGSTRPRKLNGTLLELDMVRDGRPMLVPDVQHRSRIHPELAEYTRTSCYVAAPLTSQGRVVGILHADRVRDEVGDADRELLGLFADCLGLIVERTVFLERLRAMRAQLAAQTDSIDELIEQLLDTPPLDPPHLGTRRTDTVGVDPARTAPPSGAMLGLTCRESDVLRAMSTGRTNVQIAQHLYIAEGTVKSHVKSVLRKLGAANRADAVCRYFQFISESHNAIGR
jgi:DNA-binding CsgD family transcriptional regulator